MNNINLSRGRKVALVVAIIAAVAFWSWNYNPLPPDEEMIEHFYAHRTEIEELIRRYRSFERTEPCEVPPCTWDSDPATKTLKEEAGLGRIAFVSGGPWVNDPYSADAASRARKLIESERTRHDVDRPARRHSAVIIHLAEENGFGWLSIRYGLLTKTYMHVPGVPKVENGEFWWPAGFTGDSRKDRVFKSLDSYPPHWRPSECVYRRIEAHWFLRACNLSAH